MASKKRASGEGCVRQRTDGRWEAYTPRDAFGKRRKVVRATQREALAALAGLKASPKSSVRNSAIKLRTMLDDWLERIKQPAVRERTALNYAALLRLHVHPTFGAMQLGKLTDLHIEQWYAPLYQAKPYTAKAARILLQQALDYAVKKGWIATNPARTAELTTTDPSHEIIPLTLEQARALLEATQGHRLEALYLVALTLGLRRGEVLALRWEDVDLEKGALRITGTLQRIGKKLVRGKPKTDSSAALIPLPRPVVAALLRHRERQAIEREKLSSIDAWTDTGYVFVSTVGTPLEPRNLLIQFKAVLSRAGLPSSTRFHDLRHSCATLLIAQGVHPRVVMQYLRHARISTTMDLYGHVYEEAHAAAAEGLGALLEVDTDRVLDLTPKVKA